MEFCQRFKLDFVKGFCSGVAAMLTSKLSLLHVHVRWSGPTPMCIVATQLCLELELRAELQKMVDHATGDCAIQNSRLVSSQGWTPVVHRKKRRQIRKMTTARSSEGESSEEELTSCVQKAKQVVYQTRDGMPGLKMRLALLTGT